MPVELNDRGLRAFLAGVDAELAAANAETAEQVVELAQQLAPVDEGDFRDSIQTAEGEDALSARAISDGSKAPHNIYVEFGQPDNTAYPAQPTLGPAADAIDPGLNAAQRLKALAARSKV